MSLPPAIKTTNQQVDNLIARLDALNDDLARFEYLQYVKYCDERLFYAAALRETEKILPLVYTPTVGTACLRFGELVAPIRGLWISLEDKGKIKEKLASWPTKDVRAIVVTDGERILGLGDLGAQGMGIPVGKLSLYTALAGVDPAVTLPITLDVGTNNKGFLESNNYIGLKRQRPGQVEYDAILDEFVAAVKDTFGPKVLLQWEDFGNTNAFRLLHKYAEYLPSFNDDIQGTASVVVAGLISATRITGKKLSEGTYVFYGAGEAGAGIADLLSYAMALEIKGNMSGATEEEVQAQRNRIFMIDSKGLITAQRAEQEGAGMAHHKLPYAHAVAAKEGDDLVTLEGIVRALKPSALIGVSAQPQAFSENVVKAMVENCPVPDHPIVFALSNPTSKAECTAEQAYTWTGGKAVFASGSPFDPVTLADGRVRVPGQGNNSYIFPAVGLAVIACEISKVTDHTMYVAAAKLASVVSDADLATGCLYPNLNRIREVEAQIAVAVAEDAYERGLAQVPRPADLDAFIRQAMWRP